jgi:hypothetical protein
MRLAGSGTVAGLKSITQMYVAETSPTGPVTSSKVVVMEMLLLFIAVRIPLHAAAFPPLQLKTLMRLPGALETSAADPH